MEGSYLFTQPANLSLLLEEFSIFATIHMFDHLSFKNYSLKITFLVASFILFLLAL